MLMRYSVKDLDGLGFHAHHHSMWRLLGVALIAIACGSRWNRGAAARATKGPGLFKRAVWSVIRAALDLLVREGCASSKSRREVSRRHGR